MFKGETMNHVLTLTRNNLELTKLAIESVYAQRIGRTVMHVIDNGSTDGTVEWLAKSGIDHRCMGKNSGVSKGWNFALRGLFCVAPHVLVINNDVILPDHFYAALLSYDRNFVTGVAIDDLEKSRELPQRMPLSPNPDFSAFLIHRDAWQEVGEFDESMKLYASDCDYHVRGHKAGVGMWKANVPYYHQTSSTLKNASEEDRAAIQEQAHLDRQAFREKWGCIPGEPEYQALFK